MTEKSTPSQKTNKKFQADVIKVISEAVTHTVQTLFGVDISAARVTDEEIPTDIDFISEVILEQEGLRAIVRFAFDYDLMRELISQAYPPEIELDPPVLMDAGNEIANIVSGRIKAFLNNHGYELRMNLPQSHPKHRLEHDENTQPLDILFTLRNDEFVVDFSFDRSSSKEASA